MTNAKSVQVYPAVEYDFTPNDAVAKVDDCVHFQWTGSDTNPGNNDGQGRQGTDRSNVAMLKKPVSFSFPPFKFTDYSLHSITQLLWVGLT